MYFCEKMENNSFSIFLPKLIIFIIIIYITIKRNLNSHQIPTFSTSIISPWFLTNGHELL